MGASGNKQRNGLEFVCDSARHSYSQAKPRAVSKNLSRARSRTGEKEQRATRVNNALRRFWFLVEGP